MNNPFGRAPGTTRLAFLLGTASAGVLGMTSAHAQVAEVLITGSLIAGTQSVGVPVTNLGEQDFIETGAVNVLKLLETVPALAVLAADRFDTRVFSHRGGPVRRGSDAVGHY